MTSQCKSLKNIIQNTKPLIKKQNLRELTLCTFQQKWSTLSEKRLHPLCVTSPKNRLKVSQRAIVKMEKDK